MIDFDGLAEGAIERALRRGALEAGEATACIGAATRPAASLDQPSSSYREPLER